MGLQIKKLVLISNICTYPHFFSFLSRCFNSKVPSLKSVNHEICFCFKIKPFIIQSQKKCFLQVGYCSFQLIFNFCKQERVGWGQYPRYFKSQSTGSAVLGGQHSNHSKKVFVSLYFAYRVPTLLYKMGWIFF